MRVSITCACGASIEAVWGEERTRWTHGEPPQLDQFRRDHRRCVTAAQQHAAESGREPAAPAPLTNGERS